MQAVSDRALESSWVVANRNMNKRLGIRYNSRTKILCFQGNRPLTFNYAYLGADTTAGPNYTGQDAVRSIYSNRVKGSD